MLAYARYKNIATQGRSGRKKYKYESRDGYFYPADIPNRCPCRFIILAGTLASPGPRVYRYCILLMFHRNEKINIANVAAV